MQQKKRLFCNFFASRVHLLHEFLLYPLLILGSLDKLYLVYPGYSHFLRQCSFKHTDNSSQQIGVQIFYFNPGVKVEKTDKFPDTTVN